MASFSSQCCFERNDESGITKIEQRIKSSLTNLEVFLFRVVIRKIM